MKRHLRRLSLLYHELRPRQAEYSYVLSTAEFSRQADLFVRLRTEASTLFPEITFDDGHISNFELAFPILQSRAIKASFFITVGWTEQKVGYMGWQQLRALHQEGQMIGAHGWTHTLLTHCNAQQLQKELVDARLMLEDKLGTSIRTMSLPGGRYNKRVIAACQDAGYAQIFTSVPKAEPQPAGLTIGRLNVRGDMTLDWIASLFERGNTTLLDLQRQYRLKQAAKTLLGDRLYEQLWARLNRQESHT